MSQSESRQIEAKDIVFIRLLGANIEQSKRLPNGELNYKILGTLKLLCGMCVGLWLFGEGKPRKAAGVWTTKDDSKVALCEMHGEDFEEDNDIKDYIAPDIFENGHASMDKLGFRDD